MCSHNLHVPMNKLIFFLKWLIYFKSGGIILNFAKNLNKKGLIFLSINGGALQKMITAVYYQNHSSLKI